MSAPSSPIDVLEVAVDPWNARGLNAKLQQVGVPAVPVHQTMATLTSASKEFEKLVLSGRLRHDGHSGLVTALARALMVQAASMTSEDCWRWI